MKLIFFGTPDYVLPILEEIYKNYELVAVVTQEPKLFGRKQIKTFTAVDNWAHKRKIPVYTSWDKDLPEANLGVVASFGKIIPEKVIQHFPSGVLNIHPSLLPKYRGASPIQYQIMDGVKESGITIIRMDAKMDHGPIVSQFKEIIDDKDTNETLRNRLFERSAQFLMELLPNYFANRIPAKEQNEMQATYTKRIDKELGYVDLEKDDPVEIDRKFRALKPWPGIYTFINIDGKKLRLKINEMHIEENRLILDKVQLEGKKSVNYDEFQRGYPLINQH